MLNMHRYTGVSLLLAVISLSLWLLASCGGGGGDTGGGSQLTATEKAAASASAVQGAISMSSNVTYAADMASGYIPAGYAPGKRVPIAGTEKIANLDPRLKDVVDKMLMQLQRPAVKNALSKAGTLSKVSSAPAVTSSVNVSCPSGGSYVVNDSMTSAGTATTHTLTVSYNACKNFDNSIINGSISAAHTYDNVALSTSATVTITNLTDTMYTDGTFAQASQIFALNGTFASSSTGNLSAGTATALGTFSWTVVDTVYGNMVMAFNFGTGSTPITDTWTISGTAPDTTEIHTANGTYGLTVSAPGTQSISLGITLTNLVDKYVTSAAGVDEWINGSITIGWSPDLSQWGCLSGTYVFTTAAGTPIHVASGDFCPTSGVMQVNNALIEFGNPAGYNVTVTLLPGGPSQVFADCWSMGGGMCGSQGSQTAVSGQPAAGKP